MASSGSYYNKGVQANLPMLLAGLACFVVLYREVLLLDNMLTPWSRVLFENLIGLQLVKKFPAFYGTRRVITPFTSARHLSLS